ncbi:unnamed protein product [Tetraodon nigroviridis]|uniref:Chromosome 8 SCAF15044, whole genome shotgun sequence n=1 Tax=Tetraodon nigroviridis TaxID=99883 RepID=Q4RHX1_TETNG|nr:unnamed protein product [Tetraodon nigroviridis]
MLQTIYEGESSFCTTEGRVGQQQSPNQSRMHNVNGSGDHTAVLLSFPPSLSLSLSPLSFSLRSKLLCLNLLPLLCLLLRTFTALLSPLRTYSALSWSLCEK